MRNQLHTSSEPLMTAAPGAQVVCPGRSEPAAAADPRDPERTPSSRAVGWDVLLAGGGGLLTEVAFSMRPWWPAAVLGIAVLAAVVRGAGLRRAGAVGAVWGLGFFLPHLWWANVSVGPLAWAGLSLLEAGLVGVGMLAWALVPAAVRRQRMLDPLAFAAVWTAAEQLRQVWPFGGFPWGRLAFSQVDGPLVNLAPLVGAPGVSFVVAMLGSVLARAVVDSRRRHPRSWLPWIVLVAIPLLAAATAPSVEAEEGTIVVGAVQGNVASPGLEAFAQAREVLENHVVGTAELANLPDAGRLDLVVWPENASDIDPRADGDAARLIDTAAAGTGTPILLGTDRYVADRRYNDMLLWRPGDGPGFVYSKQVPAPFGEYIPWRAFFRLFSDEVDRVRVDMVPGSATAVVPVAVERLGRDVVLGTPICFEVAYDAVVRDAVLAGAQALVVPTNNASFGYTAESVQQLAMARFRAVEHGRATVQISTVGVSAVIRPDGAVMDRTALFTADQLVAELPLRSSLTPADDLGDGPTVAVVVAAGVLVTAGVISRGARGAARRPRGHRAQRHR